MTTGKAGAEAPATPDLGVRFRVEVACDGYANLMESDVPSDVVSVEDYIAGARAAAEAIRECVIPPRWSVMMRGTGGNRFIEADATRADLMRSINDQLGDLHEYAEETGRVFDLAEVTISTKRIASGRISVSVTADLGTPLPPGGGAS